MSRLVFTLVVMFLGWLWLSAPTEPADQPPTRPLFVALPPPEWR